MMIRRRLMIAVLTATAAACGGDSTGVSATLSVEATGPAITVQAGGSGSGTITITRNGGYTGPVNLSATGLVTGIGASFSPAVVPSGSTTSTLTFTATPSSAPGNYAALVNATGNGVYAGTKVVEFTVTALPAGTFALGVLPSSVNVVAGTTTSAGITIARGSGFNSAVDLTVTGFPAGLAATMTPASATGKAATITIAAASTVAAGTYSGTITGTATGAANATATLQVVVSAPPAAGAFGLAALPSAITVASGSNGTSIISVSRTGAFTGAVELTTSGFPANVAATLSPTSAANNSTLTFIVGAGVANGNYTGTITGTGAGVTNQTVSVTLTVAPATVAVRAKQ